MLGGYGTRIVSVTDPVKPPTDNFFNSGYMKRERDRKGKRKRGKQTLDMPDGRL